jgi:uncharacterized protein (DUF2249 family)
MSRHDKLGELADITNGIEPDRLREMCDAERDGRCVVMPCKVGDVVYRLCNEKVHEGKVVHVAISFDGTICVEYDMPTYYSGSRTGVLGKTIHLTPEAAEKQKEGDSCG